FAEAYVNFGNTLQLVDDLNGAITAYSSAIRVKPEFPQAWSNLGNAWVALKEPDRAAAAYREAVRLDPSLNQPYTALGNIFRERAELEEALAFYRRGIEAGPDDPVCYPNLLYTLHFHPDFDCRALAGEHRNWNQRIAAHLWDRNKTYPND